MEAKGLTRPFCMIEEDTKKDFSTFNLVSETNDCVLIGYSPSTLTYENINMAFQKLSTNPKMELIGMHRGQFLQTSTGTNLGPGHFIKLLEDVTGRDAVAIGKPNEYFFKSAISDGIDANEVVMIGDDFNDDVLGAEQIGIHGILVKTGKFKLGQESCVRHSFDDISAAVSAIIKHNCSIVI